MDVDEMAWRANAARLLKRSARLLGLSDDDAGRLSSEQLFDALHLRLFEVEAEIERIDAAGSGDQT